MNSNGGENGSNNRSDHPLWYQRHHTQLLLYIAASFALVGLGGLLKGVLFEFLRVSIFEAGFVAVLVTATGMLSLFYALYAPKP
ncbi:DUF7521 family protein [Halorussus salilacus]|uniref:DUF7521 family protein n=1 Tax=Halorussus salilacus TaxID=2953750 RepID=UPI003F5E5F0A